MKAKVSPPVTSPTFPARLIALSGLAAVLVGCAAQPKSVDHRFSYRINGKNPEVEIVDYKYGGYRELPTQASPGELRIGRVAWSTGVSGLFPVGDYLYVKWRVLEDASIFEKRIDLRPLLPRSMHDKNLHFSFRGRDLYVYVIDRERRHKQGSQHCPAVGYELFECATTYPHEQRNF